MKNTIKNWLSYWQNLLQGAYNSRWFILFVGFVLGSLIDVVGIVSSITPWQWTFVFIATGLASYLFYIKYKLNQDTFD